MAQEDVADGGPGRWGRRIADGRTDVALIIATVFGEALFIVPGVLLTGGAAAIFRFGWADHRSATLATLVMLVAVLLEGFRELARSLRGRPVRWRSVSGVSAVFAIIFLLWLVGVLGG